jgi:PAS domain S-box-containing protein
MDLDFRALFESAPGLYLVLTPDLSIVAVSDAYLAATMTRREEILGRGLFEVFPDNPDEAGATGVSNLRASLSRVLANRAADAMALQKYDIRRPASEGGGFEERYWSPVNSPVLVAGEVAYIIHRVEDATEFVRLTEERQHAGQLTEELRVRTQQMEAEVFLRARQVQQANAALELANQGLEERVRERTADLERANQVLSDSEARFRLMVDGVTDYAIFMLDVAGRVVSWNAGAERLKGYTAEEIIGQDSARFYLDEDVVLGSPASELQAAQHEGCCERQGWRVRRDGSRFWASVTTTALHDDSGSLHGFSKITRDLTQQRLAEEAIRESEQRYHRLLDDMLESAQILGFDWRYLYLNDAAARSGHQPKAEMLGRTVMERFPGFETTEMYRVLRSCMELREARRAEFAFTYPEGGTAWFDFSIQPVPEGLFILSLDITERKLAEEGLRRSNVELEERVQERTRELAATNQELEAFSYSVSHDLRAPLRSVDGFSQVLLEDHAGQLDAEGRAHLARIRAAAQRMGGLIDDMLVLSRIARADMKREDVNLSSLADQIVQELARREPDRAVAVDIEAGLIAPGDPNLLRIALDNLLGNAWKFTRRCAEGRIWFGANELAGVTSYYVRDNGVGFDMSYADKLFAPFQRLHSPHEFEGTGIGLATVARVVRRHGGDVSAEAVVGQGATIRFTLERGPLESDVEAETCVDLA